MEPVLALVDEEAGTGFRLAGIAAEAVSTPEEMARRVEPLMADPGVRLVLLDETLFRLLPEPLQRRIEGRERPLFVPVPSPRGRRGAARPEEYVARLMRRAIGYRIRIRR